MIHVDSSSTSKPRVALVLQGGGALGAYHVGVYQAMEEAGLRPDWVSGISIGAFMASIIVGNHSQNRVKQLDGFWQDISWSDEFGNQLGGDARKTFNQMSYVRTLMFGQPDFWVNRSMNHMFLPSVEPEKASFCDTDAIVTTLQRRVDFDIINSGSVRLSLGATHIESGELKFFDNTRQVIGPEHVQASGSLPPGFPAVRASDPDYVTDQYYWDGGCVGNTPVEAIFREKNKANRPDILILVDLFNASGPVPRNMDEVNWRMKSLQFADRTNNHLRRLLVKHNLRCHVSAPPSGRHVSSPMDIIRLVYQLGDEEISNSDVEFSRPSIAARRARGYEDMSHVLSASPWKTSQVQRVHPDEILLHHVSKKKISCIRYF